MKKLVECACHGEGIVLESFTEYGEKEIYLSLWNRGLFHDNKWGLKQRLRAIWQIITKGHIWTDEIVLTEKSAQELSQILSEMTK